MTTAKTAGSADEMETKNRREAGVTDEMETKKPARSRLSCFLL